ncbi:MAG: glycine/betaine/sarcosine/D-proline family reductase selenoprotein B [Deltaproteobacteria bacterium]|nr:glycine/betaine/sarcosine/D-proline family reductase selenoprotein B [Deltaproteobacteria bacterium]
MLRILHYLNQFFAGIGGEERAGHELLFIPTPIGPGIAVLNLIKNHGLEYGTVVCGDNYFHEQEESALVSLTKILEEFAPDLFIAGPAFHAGRYGLACAKTCSFVRERRRIPVLTGMYEDNPGTREIGRHVFVIQTGSSAAGMHLVLKKFAELTKFLITNEANEIERFKEEHCLKIPRRFTVQAEAPDYVRAVDLLIAKLKGNHFESEIPRIESAPHPIPAAIRDLAHATLAVVTEGGLVPKGNPDRLESTRGSKYLKYSIKGLNNFQRGEFEAMHTGYDTSTVNEDPDRLIPLDALRSLERSGKFGKLHDYYYVTTGTGAMPSKMREIGAGIAKELSDSGVQGVILTAT